MPSMLTPSQSRAARGLLDWSQTQLAEAAHLSESSVRNFEKGRSVPTFNNLAAIRRALEEAGVEFIPENGSGPGVRLRKTVRGNGVVQIIFIEHPAGNRRPEGYLYHGDHGLDLMSPEGAVALLPNDAGFEPVATTIANLKARGVIFKRPRLSYLAQPPDSSQRPDGQPPQDHMSVAKAGAAD